MQTFFFVSRETLPIGLKKVQHSLIFPLQSIIFPRTITYTTDTIKVPQNGRKPPLSQSYGILPSFSLPNTIGFISHEDKIKKEQMEEETFHNLQAIYIINTIMQENCCHPSWYRCHETPIVKSLLWQYSQYQMAQKKGGIFITNFPPMNLL